MNAITDLALDVHELPTRYQTDFSLIHSVADALIWASGGDIWRYRPGDQPPVLVLHGDATDPIVGLASSARGYVFVTQKKLGGQDPAMKWHLYYLAQAGGTPVLLDSYDNDRMMPPGIAINGKYIAWAPFHGSTADPVSMLRFVDIDALDRPQTVQSYHWSDAGIWFPKLWGDELWYGVSVNDWTNDQAHPRVEMVDLTRPAATPTTFGQDVRAFMPAANEEVVVWKGGDTDDFAALNGASPFVYWRATGETQELGVPHSPYRQTADIQFPTVGDRFVAWWDGMANQFYVFDVKDRAVRRIADYDPHSSERILGPSVSGNLLSWVYFATDKTPGVIRWAYLPQ